MFNFMYTAVRNLSWTLLLIVQVISYGSYTILVHLCEENGRISFSSTSMNLLIELFKLAFSFSCYFFESLFINRRNMNLNTFGKKYTSSQTKKHNDDVEKNPLVEKHSNGDDDPNRHHDNSPYRKRTAVAFSFKKSMLYSIPAFLYFVNNNLAVYIQLYMDSTSYQMLSNLKIFTTAILYFIIIGKNLTKVKWFSLTLLFLAGLFYSVANLKSLSSYYIDEADLQSLFSLDLTNNINFNDEISSENLHIQQAPHPLGANANEKIYRQIKFRLRDQIYITEVGFMMMIVYCVISGLSGVYNEYLLKLNYSDSIYLQNFYLYCYGCVFNLVAYVIETSVFGRHYTINYDQDANDMVTNNWNIFNGFSVYTWIIIITQVFNGFLMSVVMKHSNNITRLFVISCSLVVTAVLSVFIFSLKLNVYFYFCFSTIMFALYLYVF